MWISAMEIRGDQFYGDIRYQIPPITDQYHYYWYFRFAIIPPGDPYTPTPTLLLLASTNLHSSSSQGVLRRSYTQTLTFIPTPTSIHTPTHRERKRCHQLHQRVHPLSTPSTGALSAHKRQAHSKNRKRSKNKTETMTSSSNKTNNKEEYKSKKNKKRLSHAYLPIWRQMKSRRATSNSSPATRSNNRKNRQRQQQQQHPWTKTQSRTPTSPSTMPSSPKPPPAISDSLLRLPPPI